MLVFCCAKSPNNDPSDTKAGFAIKVFICSLVHSASLSMNPQTKWAERASATGTKIPSFQETSPPPLHRLDRRLALLNSKNVNLSLFKKGWWHVIGEILNLHLGFLFILHAHFPFCPPFATTLSANFRETDPVIHTHHSWINSGTDTIAELQIALKSVVSVN